MATERKTELLFDCARVVHVEMPPHEPDGYTSISQPLAIGVSFTGHANAVVAEGPGRLSERTFPPGTCGINGSAPTAWLRVSEPAEGIEIHAAPEELASIAEELQVDWHHRIGLLQPGLDPVIWAICVHFRAALLGAATMDGLEAEELVRNLLVHVAVRHFNARRPRRMRGRLDHRRLARVTEFIETSLQRPPSLREMAEVAAMSPFHFHRLFRNTTGLSPQAYVMSRRIDCARQLLRRSGASVAGAAAKLGFSDLSHFRRSFRRQFGRGPGSMRLPNGG